MAIAFAPGPHSVPGAAAAAGLPLRLPSGRHDAGRGPRRLAERLTRWRAKLEGIRA